MCDKGLNHDSTRTKITIYVDITLWTGKAERVIDITEDAKKDAIKLMETAFLQKTIFVTSQKWSVGESRDYKRKTHNFSFIMRKSCA